MRLQLIVALTLVATRLHAQEAEPWSGEATTRTLVYGDNDETTVVTTTIDAETALPRDVTVGAHVLVDVISSASVDVVSAATERWDENRVELGARAAGRLFETSVSVGYVRSQENDWLSNTVSIGASKELFERNTIVSATCGVSLNKVGRASDPSFERSLSSYSAEISASQLLDKRTRVAGTYTLQYLSGYLASPYRFVGAADGTAVPERHPDSRLRHAASGIFVRALTHFLASHVGYRFYVDDWGIRSHTATLRFVVDASDWWSAGIEGRVYRQSKSEFYQASYATSFRFMTSDRELSTFWDAGGTADVAVHLGPVTADARVGAIRYEFQNFAALRSRVALLVGGGVKVSWR